MGKYSILASTSLMFNVVAFFSLVYTIHQTKNTTSFNWSYLLGNIIAQLLLVVYGLANKAPEIYGPTMILMIGLAYIVYIKTVYTEEIIVEKPTKHNI